jgi:hypothetical protein
MFSGTSETLEMLGRFGRALPRLAEIGSKATEGAETAHTSLVHEFINLGKELITGKLGAGKNETAIDVWRRGQEGVLQFDQPGPKRDSGIPETYNGRPVIVNKQYVDEVLPGISPEHRLSRNDFGYDPLTRAYHYGYDSRIEPYRTIQEPLAEWAAMPQGQLKEILGPLQPRPDIDPHLMVAEVDGKNPRTIAFLPGKRLGIGGNPKSSDFTVAARGNGMDLIDHENDVFMSVTNGFVHTQHDRWASSQGIGGPHSMLKELWYVPMERRNAIAKLMDQTRAAYDSGILETFLSR